MLPNVWRRLKRTKVENSFVKQEKKPFHLPLGSLTFISILTIIINTAPITFIDDKYLIEFTDYISLNHSLFIFLISIIFYY